MNKAKRASLTVVCPTCGAKRGERCTAPSNENYDFPAIGFSHVERFRKAIRMKNEFAQHEREQEEVAFLADSLTW